MAEAADIAPDFTRPSSDSCCCCVGDAACPAGRTTNESASIIRLCVDAGINPHLPAKLSDIDHCQLNKKDGGSCSPKSAAQHDETKQPRELDRRRHPHRRERAGKHHQSRRGGHISAAALSLDLLARSVGGCCHISVSIDKTCIVTAEHSHVCEQRPSIKHAFHVFHDEWCFFRFKNSRSNKGVKFKRKYFVFANHNPALM